MQIYLSVTRYSCRSNMSHSMKTYTTW